MKKVFSLLAVLALVCMGSTAFAAFTGETKKALATIDATGQVEFSVNLYDWESTYSAATSTDTIHWDNTNTLTLASDTEQFLCANVYALIKSTITTMNTKILIYQNNKANTDGHVAVSSRNVSGVWRYDGLVDTTGTKYATLSYRCRTLTDAKAITTLPNKWPSWQPYDGVRVIYDKNNSDWATQAASEYVVIGGINAAGGGTWVGSGDWGTTYTKEDVVMFFGAQFKNVLSGESYGTNTIKFNTVVE